jgi:hypothetical protein
VFEEALNALKFLGWLKKFGPAQNILRPVKGQGISVYLERGKVHSAEIYFVSNQWAKNRCWINLANNWKGKTIA